MNRVELTIPTQRQPVPKYAVACLVWGFIATILHLTLVPAADWPQFRGPTRDGQLPETDLLKKWPEAGPRLLHTISGIGEGYSSPSIAGERIYVTGNVGADLKLFCFDLAGNKLWEQTHGPAFRAEGARHWRLPRVLVLDMDRGYASTKHRSKTRAAACLLPRTSCRV